MTENRKNILQLFNEWKFPVAIILLLGGIVFSKWLLSASQFLLAILIIFDKNGLKRIIKAFTNPIVIALISIYAVHLLGLLWTEDFKYAAKDLKIKLPLLSFPILFAAIPEKVKDKSEIFLKIFVLFVTAMSTINIVRYFILPHTENYQIAIWHSHIRFSLLTCLAILISFWLIIEKKVIKKEKAAFIISILILSSFLFILNSLTGIFIFILLIIYISTKKSLSLKFKIGLWGATIVIISLLSYEVIKVKNNFFPTRETVTLSNLEKFTPSGNPYLHDTNNLMTENGKLLYIYVSPKEIVQEWNKRSDIKLAEDSLSCTYYAIIRYLASINERKDSCGMSKLTENDIKNIEKGIANRGYADINPIEKRIYKLFWEITSYKITGNPSGHSLTQRFEFWKTSTKIIKEHPIIGVGTGDVQKSFDEMYERTNSPLDKEHRLRSHNQYFAFTIAFGLIGLAIFIFSIIFPILRNKQNQNFLYIGYIFIFLLSMLNEDTLETQVGVTFYALFNCLFLFIINQKIGGTSDEKRINTN